VSQRSETLPFQAEAQEVLSLMIHALYKHEDVFLRELVSNASDALDKLRLEALTRPELSVEKDAPRIRIEADRRARTLSVDDNGIGMSRDDLVQHLGTIARSGTKQFVASLRAARAAAETAPASTGPAELPELIGQFGVGFYSSFIVADDVVVDTLRAGETTPLRWRSRGEGEYTIEPGERSEHGTRVTLHLREHADGEEREDFLAEHAIRDIVKRYSDFVAYPIQMQVEPREASERRAASATDGERWETLNSMKPLWSRKKEEITRAEYTEFYHHLTHDWNEPLEVIHLKAEGTTEYTALLYVPASRPLDVFEAAEPKSRLSLYVRRVLIMAECEDLLPPWLRFVRGLVDAPDLPLNVSREVLQRNPIVRQIQKRLVKRVLDAQAQMLAADRGKYRRFWDAFGVLLKEGIYVGADDDQQISRIALFASSRTRAAHATGDTGGAATAGGESATESDRELGDELTTLGEYVARMRSDQKAIYYVAGADLRALERSPHLEAFAKRGIEVLLLADPVDEWMVGRLREFEKKPLVPVDRGELDLESGAERQVREDLDREHRDVLAAVELELSGDVKSVRFTNRLQDSPAVLVNEAGALSPHMERVLRAARQDVPHAKRILELNPEHPLIRRLEELHKETGASAEFRDYAQLLYAQTLLAEGSPLPDASKFARQVAELMMRAPRDTERARD
jgi:molecular chaperone HtpG